MRNEIDEYLSFESYLFTITYNTTISFIRKKVKESKYIEYLKSIQNPSIQINISINTVETHMERALKAIHKNHGEVSMCC